ncbi:hypothetical protein [Pedobacter ureilyticus]|uniref:DUF4175 family protein n=1 Tax=Pedobacter ureilyticus TaxID=1393051 RepID=A0ABW9J7M0_9SPHI|nr:hypothetical protein [Pedobacter helvus]
MQSQHYINKLKYKWIVIYLIQGIAICLGFSLLTTSVWAFFFSPHYGITLFAFLLPSVVFCAFRPIWKIDKVWVVRYLDSQFPILEDSASLLLKDTAELSLLENLQVAKIYSLLPKKGVIKGAAKKIAVGICCLALGVTSVLTLGKLKNQQKKATLIDNKQISVAAIPENIAPQISDYLITIQAPSYTLKPARTQKQFTLKAEIGATVKWSIQTNKSLQSFEIVFNDKERIKLKPTDQNATQWSFSKKIDKPGFYQLGIDGVKSDLYQIELIPDHPVNIKVIQPKPQTTIDIGQAAKIDLSTILTDDYGIKEALISATMASGKGESVSFTEKKLSFDIDISNKKKLNLKKHINLKSLGMKPGDELYFFIQAKDNKGQESRSDVYSVSIIDTAELMSMAGMTSGVNLVPEYFRSQRQIILDTEKLLAEKAALRLEEFKKRSNNLGVDQKLLRLRYGQFLGEENETQIGGDDEHHDGDGHDHGNHKEEEKFGDVQALMDKYAHKHDIAEDATFFEPEIKAQLKAVLNEMWKAELNLRTYKPQEALPFEYKALRLLKDLQQKSRAYVAKTTIKTTTLKLEKRLTGELDKITNPNTVAQYEITDRHKDELKVLLAMLDLHRDGNPFNNNEKALLQNGEKQIISAAADNPASFLPALTSLRKLNSRAKLQIRDLETVSSAIYRIIGKTTTQPKAATAGSSKKLSESYFNNLKNRN